MDNEATVQAFQSAVIIAASEKLGRPLTEREQQFITSRGGFLALEAIADTVRSEAKARVEQYLNSA